MIIASFTLIIIKYYIYEERPKINK